MKSKFAFFVAILLHSSGLSAQKPALLDEKIYEMYEVTKEPTFPGGLAKMYQFLLKSNHSAVPKDSILGSRLILSFVVDTSGYLTDIQVVKDIGGGFGQDFVNVLKSMPTWIPGEFEGRKVKVKYILPMTFCFRD